MGAEHQPSSIVHPENWYPQPSGQKTPEKPQDPNAPIVIADGEAAENSRAEKLREKKQPSLGELNPMLFPPDFRNQEAIDALTQATKMQIEAYGGLQPNVFEKRYVVDDEGKHHSRLVIRFDIPDLTEEQVVQLEEVAREVYGSNTRTRKSSSGSALKPVKYPTIDLTPSGKLKQADGDRKLGWFMGVNENPPSRFHTGMFVFKDLGGKDMANFVHDKKPDQWFFKEDLIDPIRRKPNKTGYLVEIREATRYQTDIALLATEIASILGGNGIIPYDELFYQTYNNLNRIGTEDVRESDIHGLDQEIQRIKRTLFYPLGNLDLSSGIDLKPGSVLLTGYMGTGKTHLAKHFLQQDTGTILAPVDVTQLAQDLAQPNEKRSILPRINEVFRKYQIPVVLHIDDVESIAASNDQMNSTLLNLMAGIREAGFYLMASTNYPERLSPQLLQPQRFAHLVHVGLPSEEARMGILDIHATQMSQELGKELFESEEERELILKAVAMETEGATARVLADICTEAKSYFEERQIMTSGVAVGLTEKDIQGRFTVSDWENGLREALRKFNTQEVVARDKELREFAEKHYRGGMGFVANGTREGIDLKKTIDELSREVKIERPAAEDTTPPIIN